MLRGSFDFGRRDEAAPAYAQDDEFVRVRRGAKVPGVYVGRGRGSECLSSECPGRECRGGECACYGRCEVDPVVAEPASSLQRGAEQAVEE